ncbi:HesA/MoeB/ThiF family protein [Oceanidesulfovibrio indonesiensis]|uniref:HesA/MoeB/ThiF family protein n=1 Tax=Oceanidesulfovibrio indonesiensis TaxID=54767 RepID=A0A7M3MBZ7_9BACT|nr:HesA/MoeB/ThiF family protein [Oceanidesulfovibrio indonesiensis]TVM15387.1 HesA/MoeB/ThiF family protein [Oceanidesulfovibrio indonesiensis]
MAGTSPETLAREALGRFAGGSAPLNPLDEHAVASMSGLSLLDVERTAVRMGILPERYRRNTNTINLADQAVLLDSRVAMVGLGGLGGYVLESLARIGVGRIRAAEGDVFEASNLNRQLLSEERWLGVSKAAPAKERIPRINPAVELETVEAFLNAETVGPFLDGVDLVMDCLGGLDFRAPLQHAAAEAGIPMVTAAVAGWCGYVGAVAPGAPGPADLLPRSGGVEDEIGTPPPTVMLAASLQARECVRILLGGVAEQSVLLFDLADSTFETIRF